MPLRSKPQNFPLPSIVVVQPQPHRNPIMAQSKAAKRKRKAQAQAQADHPSKAVKTGSSPAGDAAAAAGFEPKSLQTVISDEELEITIDTLATLAKYPNLTKSKLCKDLRVAVYDFRQSCTTGVNAAGRFSHRRTKSV